MLTQNEFERDYAKRNGVAVSEFREHMISLPCNCGDEDCKGWAAISRDPEAIERHLKYYAPGAASDAIVGGLGKLGFKSH